MTEDYDELIRRAIDRMKSEKANGDIPSCPNPDCGRKLVLRRSNVGAGGANPYRDDQMWKCCGPDPEQGCKATLTFGIPISEEVYEQEIMDREGSILAPEAKNIIEVMDWEAEEVKNRLENLGYMGNELDES